MARESVTLRKTPNNWSDAIKTKLETLGYTIQTSTEWTLPLGWKVQRCKCESNDQEHFSDKSRLMVTIGGHNTNHGYDDYSIRILHKPAITTFSNLIAEHEIVRIREPVTTSSPLTAMEQQDLDRGNGLSDHQWVSQTQGNIAILRNLIDKLTDRVKKLEDENAAMRLANRAAEALL